MSEIHLRNLYELSRLSNVWIVPPMMTFYQKPESIDDMVTHLAAKLLSPFGVEVRSTGDGKNADKRQQPQDARWK